ncbi:PREDICTED: uncharacterized protein LOC107171372 [Diuraphis noxia]|uniref:uncharacterized protein LOC107171372 n=1 Tax=Diuraphis noxia TaxID=143948 RepID=UPI0007639C14|nr:PREDICTED: uncharacterized protein LOC107171372 [Diuraphis noxia]
MEYSVVEFTDGINLVPTIWLTADRRKCHWPLIENKMIYSKMVSSQVVPRSNDPSWGIYPIKKVLCRTNTYQEGMHKLKIAEKYSEVESASDADPKAKRAKRQLRAKKNLFDNLSESDSDSTTSNHKYDDMANTNLLKTQSTSEDQTQHNIHEDVTISQFPQFPDPIVETKNFTPKSLTKTQHSYTLIEDTLISQLSIFPDQTDETIISTPKSLTKIFTAKEVYKMLSKINSEIIQVREEIADVKEHVLQQNRSSNDCLNSTELASSTLTFDTNLPYLTDNQFKAAENKINDPACLTLLIMSVNDLKRLGGTDYEDVVNNALAYVISNQLACQYSWKGKRSKSSFSNEFKQFNKAILILVRLTKPDLTNKMYGEIVANWINQRLKTSKMNS